MCLITLPFLQESFAVDIVLAHGGGLPCEVRAAGVALEEERLAGLVPAADEQRDAEGPHAAGLGVLLHDERHAVHQLRRGDVLVVHQVVVLRHLARAPDQQPVVGPHAAVHHPDVAGNLLDLVGGVILEQDGLVLLLGGENHSIDSLDGHDFKQNLFKV